MASLLTRRVRGISVASRESIASYVNLRVAGPDGRIRTRRVRRRLAYARVAAAAHRFARELESRGVERGERS